jgi:2'-5' RNA ligase
MKARDGLKGAALSGRFTFDENLHITLVFLGECDGRQTEETKRVMNGVTFPAFPLELDRPGFYRRGGGDLWWVGLKESAPLLSLQSELEQKLGQAGFILESRKFTPHITLGREVKALADFTAPKIEQAEFNVTRIELMKSEHINGKLTYTPIYSKNAEE